MKKFVLRHWRGNGQVIPSIMKDSYMDYPKNSMNRNSRAHSLSECIVSVISEEEFLSEVLSLWGIEAHNRSVKKYKLGLNKLIK